MTQLIRMEILHFFLQSKGPKRWMHSWLSNMSFYLYFLLGGHMGKAKWQSKSTFCNILTPISCVR